MFKFRSITSHSVLRYFIVGSIAFACDYLVLTVCYYVVGVPLKTSTTIGFFTGFLVSFSVNKQWVFKGNQKKRVYRQVVEYLSLLGFNYLFTVWAITMLNEHGIGPAISKIAIMGLIICWNYALFKWLIFAHKD